MDRFKKGTETQTGTTSYTYSYSESQIWKFCPHCRKRLFEVLRGTDFEIEIKCRSCKKLVRIEE